MTGAAAAQPDEWNTAPVRHYAGQAAGSARNIGGTLVLVSWLAHTSSLLIYLVCLKSSANKYF